MYAVKRNTAVTFLNRDKIKVLNTIFGVDEFDLCEENNFGIIDLVKVKLYRKENFLNKSKIVSFINANSINFFGLIIFDEEGTFIDVYVRNKYDDLDYIDCVSFKDKEKYFNVTCVEND